MAKNCELFYGEFCHFSPWKIHFQRYRVSRKMSPQHQQNFLCELYQLLWICFNWFAVDKDNFLKLKRTKLLFVQFVFVKFSKNSSWRLLHMFYDVFSIFRTIFNKMMIIYLDWDSNWLIFIHGWRKMADILRANFTFLFGHFRHVAIFRHCLPPTFKVCENTYYYQNSQII